MEQRYDISFDAAYINASNDANWIVSDEKHVRATIEATPGSYKENQGDGAAIMTFVSSSGAEDEIAQKIIFELSKDLYKCVNPIIAFDANGTLLIDPNL